PLTKKLNKGKKEQTSLFLSLSFSLFSLSLSLSLSLSSFLNLFSLIFFYFLFSHIVSMFGRLGWGKKNFLQTTKI
ncbi:hypothetical protein ACMBCM_08980, partial [Spiroplasma sp. K1]